MDGRMPPVSADNKVSTDFQFAAWHFCPHAHHAVVLENEIDNFVLHEQLKTREPFRVRREKIEKIPLRHKSDELAARGKFGEISNRHGLTVDHGMQFSGFLMRLLQK